jgi:hypothetical protein
MFKQAGLGLTPLSPLIRHHPALNLVYFVCLVYLVRPDKPIHQTNWPSLARRDHFAIHILRFMSPERQDDFSGGKRYS